ncbi:hypothetical protein A3K80_02305 [Candidatus Bathyarchaeota archaeon RBG_13_38_9]|nr:MAG: hypothetical protein A3K80_02305 [Candidatus Bathyarchaeota archaeon RBG_13_38_9]
MLELILVVIAALVGIVSAMIGLGGGFLIVPLLVLLFNVEIHQAVGTSLTMMVFTAASATFAYARQKRIDYKVGLILTIGTVPGAVLGAYLTTLVSGKLLTGLLAAFLLLVATLMMRKEYKNTKSKVRWQRMIVDSQGVSFNYSARLVPGIILSIFGGVVSGFFGIGVGTVMVPVMVLIVGIPIHITVAVSMFIMFFTSISGALTHLALGDIMPEYALYLSVGIIFGTQVGAAAARKMKSRPLQMIFAIFLVVVAVRMILGLL